MAEHQDDAKQKQSLIPVKAGVTPAARVWHAVNRANAASLCHLFEYHRRNRVESLRAIDLTERSMCMPPF